jgi:hypothetical protein
VQVGLNAGRKASPYSTRTTRAKTRVRVLAMERANIPHVAKIETDGVFGRREIVSVGKGLGWGPPVFGHKGFCGKGQQPGGRSQPHLADAGKRERDSNSSKGPERPRRLQCYAREGRRWPRRRTRRSVTKSEPRWQDVPEAFLEQPERSRATVLKRLPLSGQLPRAGLRETDEESGEPGKVLGERHAMVLP